MLPGWRPGLLGDLRERLATSVVLENEVNLAARAEHREGAAAGRDDFIMLWLDDGVGSAIVLGGAPRQGASGGGGEIGFLGSPAGSICDLLTREEVARVDIDELARRAVLAAFPWPPAWSCWRAAPGARAARSRRPGSPAGSRRRCRPRYGRRRSRATRWSRERWPRP